MFKTLQRVNTQIYQSFGRYCGAWRKTIAERTHTSIKQEIKRLGKLSSYYGGFADIKYIDNMLAIMLAKSVTSRHPKMQEHKVLERYFFKDHKGRHIFALKNDKSMVKVTKLQKL